MARSRLLPFLRAALVAALVAVGAMIAVPIGPVPVTLQVLVIAVAALVLSPAEAVLAIALYLALGAAGAPVFSGGGAGVGVLTGPTGGFLMGFLLATPAGSLVRRAISARTGRRWAVIADGAALLALVSITYATGLAQFTIVTGQGVAKAFAVAVAPFVLIDLAKAATAILVARGVRAAGLADTVAPVGKAACASIPTSDSPDNIR